MNKVTTITMIVAFIWGNVLITVSQNGSPPASDYLTVKATVVANYIIPSIMWDIPTNSLREEIILLRVDERLAGEVPAHFIRVHYKFFGIGSGLPSDMFLAARKWRFSLLREPGCDGPLFGSLYPDDRPEDEGKGEEPILLRTPAGKNERLSTETILPCYLLQPGGFTRVIEGDNGIMIKGRIVAWTMTFEKQTDIPTRPFEAFLLMSVEQLIEGRQEARYVRVHYKYSKTKPGLPTGDFPVNDQWKMLLMREPRCDGPLERPTGSLLPDLHRAKGYESAKLPTEDNLPCYVLNVGDFSLVTR
jgi:hypothetical protein